MLVWGRTHSSVHAERKLGELLAESEVGPFRESFLTTTPILSSATRIRYLWRQDAQVQNVREIAKCGADLYDKFAAFVVDLQDVGDKLQKAQNSYDSASKKLHDGRGNLVSRADRLRRLGVAPKKLLAPELVEAALEEPITMCAVADDTELVDDEVPTEPVSK